MSHFRKAGEPFPLSKDDPTDPSWVAEDIIRRAGDVDVFTFWFEFASGNAADVIGNLRAAGAQDARLDGSSQIILIEAAKPDSLRDLAAICLREGGRYQERLPRVSNRRA